MPDTSISLFQISVSIVTCCGHTRKRARDYRAKFPGLNRSIFMPDSKLIYLR